MPPIRPELLDELLKDYQKPEDLLGQDGLLQQLTKALVKRALDGELTHHLASFGHRLWGCKPFVEGVIRRKLDLDERQRGQHVRARGQLLVARGRQRERRL